jgi:hypothetical protein
MNMTDNTRFVELHAKTVMDPAGSKENRHAIPPDTRPRARLAPDRLGDCQNAPVQYPTSSFTGSVLLHIVPAAPGRTEFWILEGSSVHVDGYQVALDRFVERRVLTDVLTDRRQHVPADRGELVDDTREERS